MTKQKKSTKRFNKNTKLRSAVMKSRKIQKAKKHETEIKNQKLLAEEFSESEDEQDNMQHYLKKDAKVAPKKAAKATITGEEVAKFFNSLSQNEDALGSDDEDDEINALVQDIGDFDPDTYEGSDDEEEEQNEDEQEENEMDEDEEENNEERAQLESIVNEDEMNDSDDEEFVKPEGIDDEEEEEAEQEPIEEGRVALNKQLIASWIAHIRKDHSIKALKRLLLSFYAAAHMNDANIPKSKKSIKEADGEDVEDEDELKIGGGKKKKKRLTSKEKETEFSANIPYVIPNNAIYMRVIVGCLKYATPVFQHYTKHDPNSYKLPVKESNGWKKVHLCVKSLLKSLVHLLTYVTNKDLLGYVLMYVEKLLPYFGHYTMLSRRLLKCLLNFLGHDKEIVRYQSFLNIRNMAQLYPYPFLDLTFKGVYFTLVQNANIYTPSNFGVIDFLKNAVVELCRIDFKTSYQHAFIYIRELAITLRKALEPKKLAYVACYNWRFINTLDTWVRAVSQFPNEGELKELLYPLTHIVQGVMQAHKHAKHFSIMFKCLEMLNRLARDTYKTTADIFGNPTVIPVMPFILDLLETREIYHTPRNIASMPIDFEFKLKTRTQTIKTKEFNQRSVDEIIFIMLDHFALHSRSPAFPEMSFPATHYLKNFLKKHSKTLHAAQIKRISALVKKIRESADFIMQKRSQVEFTPLNMEKSKGKWLDANETTPLEKMYQEELEVHNRAVLDRIKSKVEGEKKQNEEEDVDSDEEQDEEEETPVVAKKGNKRLRDEDESEEPAKKKVKPAKKAAPVVVPKTKLKPSKTADTVKALSLDDF